MQLEICIENLQEAELANSYSVNRIEVCSALDLGGLTASYGLIKACAGLSNVESHVLIRPRAGNFIYTSKEIILMKEDIRKAAEAGASGVVFGCLNQKNEIDSDSCDWLLRLANGYQLKSTFHRAIDFTTNYLQSAETLIDLGFNRILTSGKSANAFDGIDEINALIVINNSRIEIMAGGGISIENVSAFRGIGLDAIHFSIRKKNDQINALSMGFSSEADEEKLKQIIQKMKENEKH
jgi:copper homeostasis protein